MTNGEALLDTVGKMSGHKESIFELFDIEGNPMYMDMTDRYYSFAEYSKVNEDLKVIVVENGAIKLAQDPSQFDNYEYDRFEVIIGEDTQHTIGGLHYDFYFFLSLCLLCNIT